MAIGFSLFSFDLFEASRRRSEEADDRGDVRNHSHQSTLSGNEDESRLRKETVGKLYFPVP